MEVTLDLTDVVPQFDSFHPFNPFRFSPNIHLKFSTLISIHFLKELDARICLKIKPFSLSFTTPFIILEARVDEGLTPRTLDLEVRNLFS